MNEKREIVLVIAGAFTLYAAFLVWSAYNTHKFNTQLLDEVRLAYTRIGMTNEP